MENYILEIKSLINSTKENSSSEDFIDTANNIIEFLQNEIENSQEEINQQVEFLVDSFGGKNCTIRQLKGE